MLCIARYNTKQLEFIMGNTESYSVKISGYATPADAQMCAQDHNLNSINRVKVIQLHNKRTNKTMYIPMSAGLLRLLMVEVWSLNGDWKRHWNIQYLSYVRDGKVKKEIKENDFVVDDFRIWWR